VIEIMEVTKLTKLVEIAKALNLRGIKTARGCQIATTQVRRLIQFN